MSFGKEVTATLGKQKLTSDQLFILKMAASDKNGKKTSSATQPVGDASASAATETSGATAATAPAATAPAGDDDLTVTWTGPMEMRPATAEDAPLAGPSDLVLEAVGTPERPVELEDPLHTALAGRLRYHKQNTAVELEPGDVGRVVVTDADASDPVHTVRTIRSGGLSYSRDTNHVHLVGPVSITIPQATLRRTATTGPAAGVAEPALVITVERSLDADLSPVVDPKDPNRVRSTPVLRHAVFAGRTSIVDVGFQLEADALDVVMGTDAKGSQLLEHLLATGTVHVKTENRPGMGITDAAKPDGLIADRLEVRTALFPGSKALQPSRFLATGNVTAWVYDTNGQDKGHGPAKRTVFTPALDAVLMPKVATKVAGKAAATMAAAGPADNFKDVDVKTLTATDGVIVEMEVFGNLPVFAKAKTLTVNRENGPESALAVLDGERLGDGTIQYAEVSQGERGANKVTGLQILLNEKNKSIDVPGRGVFDFLQQAEKAGQPAYPVEVSWTQSMHFDTVSNQASFLGDIDAHLVGKTDQVSNLTAHKELDVYLIADAEKGAATAPAEKVATTMPLTSRLHLSKIFAQGNVEVLGESLDPAGKLLTRVYLQKVDSLTYNAGTKTLDIPGSGALLLQDYRPEKIDPKNPDKTDDSSGHGDTAFSWEGSLVYNGPSGTITFTKNVYMKHLPLKPFKVPGEEDATKAVATAPAGAAANPPLVLTTQTLVAKLLQSKAAGGGDTIASPLAMGAGGAQKISSVDARGNSVMTLGESRLGAETLHFDALTHIATADGTPDNPAEFIRPGQGLAHYDHVSWDLTKGKNAVEATGVHGAFQQN